MNFPETAQKQKQCTGGPTGSCFQRKNWQNTKLSQSFCVVDCKNWKMKGTKPSFYHIPSGTTAFYKKESAALGKLMVKIGMITMNGHTKGFRDKEFAEHTFFQVS